MTYEIRGVRDEDLPCLAASLRGADIRELVASYGHARVLEGLQHSVQISEEVKVGTSQGSPFIICGIKTLTPEAALIWCCATPMVNQFALPFVRETRSIFKQWFLERPALRSMLNFSHAANVLHHRWLRAVGATVLPAIPMGPRLEPFSPFSIRRERYV